MSQFISSFLIEPVVRQARRFSRTSLEDEPQSPRHDDTFPEFNDALASSSTEEACTSEQLGGQESSCQRLAVESKDTIPPAPEAQTPDGRNRADHVPQAQQSVPSSTHVLDSEPPRTRAETDPQAQATTTRLTVRERFHSANASLPTSLNQAGLRSLGLTGNLQQSAMSSNMSSSPPPVDSALPEDDGMGQMRKRILDIQKSHVSAEEKSRLMHTLMTEQYIARSPGGLRPRSPGSFRSQDRPWTPNSALSTLDASHMASPLTSRSSVGEETYLSADDLKPTYWVPPAQPSGQSTANHSPEESRKNSMDVDEEEQPLGCRHYRRNVKLQCFTCSKWYTCRFCHDEVEEHALIRRETRNMLCMFCGTAQPAAGECRECGEDTACYYCDICKLWDNDPSKSIYHCDDCGICRVGEGLGKDFYHCKNCNVCLSMQIRDSHRCIERSTDCECPICGEYMFTSIETVVLMRCGHSIHKACYKKHMQNSFKCPICSRSLLNMEMTFRNLDRTIEAQPMPEQFRDTKAFVYCNDCSAKSSVMYHWLGLKCAVCDSYNTAQLRILSDGSPPSSPPAEHAAPPIDMETDLLETLRGRTLTINNQNQRTATSTSALDHLRPQPNEHRGRMTRAASEEVPSTQKDRGFSTDDSSEDDAMDTDGEDSVEFWGGESPREKTSYRRVLGEGIAYEGSTDESDDSDVTMEDDDDEDEDDSADERDDLHLDDLIGHR